MMSTPAEASAPPTPPIHLPPFGNETRRALLTSVSSGFGLLDHDDVLGIARENSGGDLLALGTHGDGTLCSQSEDIVSPIHK